MVTIATNMAGRGTDIVLGGNVDSDKELQKKNYQNVVEKGGLHIIGTKDTSHGELIIIKRKIWKARRSWVIKIFSFA